MGKCYIFGAGHFGSLAYNELGGSAVFDAFIDNDKKKIGKYIFECPIISLSEVLADGKTDQIEILICVEKYEEIVEQLDAVGLLKYDIFLPEYLDDLKELPVRLINNRVLRNQTGKKFFIEGIKPYKKIIKRKILTIFPDIKFDNENNNIEYIISASPHFPELKCLELLHKVEDKNIINPFRKYWHLTDGSIINNKYSTNTIDTEKEVIENIYQDKNRRKRVNGFAKTAFRTTPLFKLIEIETLNRCNGTCSFCPVNARIDPRKRVLMQNELYKKIIDELADIEYTGVVSTFSNNEPLLDNRIVSFNEYARIKLPNATLQMYTNGTLLDLDLFKQLIEQLDFLIIDNYDQNLELIEPVKRVYEYVLNNPHLINKIRIDLRKPNEILSTRGNHAPNRKIKKDYGDERCATVYEQMVIRPDGKVSLCCNDPMGEYTLGDVNCNKLIEIWNGEKYYEIRKRLNEGRKMLGNCRYCDVFNLFSIS